jgi:hypothetical protein
VVASSTIFSALSKASDLGGLFGIVFALVDADVPCTRLVNPVWKVSKSWLITVNVSNPLRKPVSATSELGAQCFFDLAFFLLAD